MPRETLADYFRDLENRRGTYLVHDDGYRTRRHSYQEVARAARAFAARLQDAGIGKGDKVLFWGENRPEWVVAYWACVIAGVVLVPIDYRASVDFARRVSGIVQPKLALIGDEVRWPDEPSNAFAVWRFDSVSWSGEAAPPAATLGRDDLLQIVFTSGATAEPKGVLITHRNVLANTVPVEAEILKYRRYARPFSPIRFLNLLPLSHMFGQSMAATIPPLIDGTVIFMRSLHPQDIVRTVRQLRISVIVCVPKILDVLREHALHAHAVPSDPPTGLSIPQRWWRYRAVHRAFGLKFWAFIVGAAPLGQALEDFWKRLGFVVIQGYGLTETAPIVTLNHPFRTSTGSVGTPIGGVEIRIAEDGEVLVRGENVTSGYYGGDTETGTGRSLDADGWLHTGDVGELDANGRLFIKGRKKEMIVTPEGLNVFPDDVERAVNAVPGVIESAVVGVDVQGQERVHAVLVLQPGTDPAAVVRTANSTLADHQRIRGYSTWDGALPRTEGTRKLRRQAIRDWVRTGHQPAVAAGSEDVLEGVMARFAGTRGVEGTTSIEELGLSSLERVELMVALEDRLQTRFDEVRFAEARTVDELRALVTSAPRAAEVEEPVDFPAWNRSPLVGLVRRVSLATWILPLARVFAWVKVSGRAHLQHLDGPVVFAANHQSHFDVPVLLAALPGRIRRTVAPAMAKEFFKAHFFPQGEPRRKVFTRRLNYYLAAFFFNAFPLPQREAGARQTLRYIGEIAGDGFSLLIFPEGARTQAGEIAPFRGGIGMIGARLGLPVVPVRIIGADRILHQRSRMARPGRVEVRFGRPLRLSGEDYGALAKQVEDAVRNL